MPSFDILSEVDEQEIDNALNQARKELVTRFDLKDAKTEIVQEKDKIVLLTDDTAHLRALREIVIGKLSKRGVDLRNVKQDVPALSSVGICDRQNRRRRRSEYFFRVIAARETWHRDFPINPKPPRRYLDRHRFHECRPNRAVENKIGHETSLFRRGN